MKSGARLDLADLRLFVAIADAGSITKGAVQASLALASASERLRNIEEEAGTPLLVRQARGVVTTEAGEAMLHHARLILQQQALMRRELQEFATGQRGTLHLYANTSALTEYLPGLLAPWLGARPKLRLELKERSSAEIVRTVANGHAEAGVASDAVDAMGLTRLRLYHDRLALICAPRHRLARHKRLRFEQVLGEPFVGLAGRSALQDMIEGHAEAAGGRLQIRIRLKTFDAVCEVVSQGIGVAILPLSSALRNQERFDFSVLELDDAWTSRWHCACFRDWDELSSPMQSLLTHLQTSLSPQG